MRQLLQSFWEGTEKNALLLCKIAWKTIWRYGIAGMLFLTVGLTNQTSLIIATNNNLFIFKSPILASANVIIDRSKIQEGCA